MIFYRHKKTGKTYRLLAAGVDCTNVRNGTAVAIYCPNDELNAKVSGAGTASAGLPG